MKRRNMRILCVLFCVAVCCQSTFPWKLLYANEKDIRLFWSDNKGSASERVIISTDDAVAVDFLYKNHLIFWSDVSEEKIFRCSLKTTCKAKVIVSGSLGRPEGLAVDWLTGKLYWTDYDFKQICVSSIDGKYRKVLIWKNLDNPRAIAVDPNAGFMFWSDWGEAPGISRAGMDGTNHKNIVSTSITWPNGLTLDYHESRLYWIDARHEYIASVDYHGNGRRITYSQAANHPYSITMLRKQLYWTDWDTNSIQNCAVLRANMSNSANVIKTNIYSPMDIKTYDPQRQSNVSFNPCERENGGCSHLCLLAPGKRFSCACPSGVALKSDMKTCEDGPQKFLLLTKRRGISILSLSTQEHTDLKLPIEDIGHVIAVDFDPVQKSLCWIDSQYHEIKCASINGSGAKTIFENNSSSAEDLAIDWVNRGIYWTDSASDIIAMAYLNGTSGKDIVSRGLDEPRAIIIDQQQRFMYWSDWGENPKIERAMLDGTKREILINTSIAWPNSLVLDYQQRKLYWADAKLDKIESCDLTGSDRVIVTREDVPHIFSLTLVGQYLYWTDVQTRMLVKMDKSDPKKREIIINYVPNMIAVRGVDLQTN